MHAKELGMQEVPCEIRNFSSKEEIELSILSYNKNRTKTYVQQMKEIDEEKELREKLKLPATSEVLGKLYGMSKGRFHRKMFVWEKAKEGDERAIELVERLSADERYTTAKAYADLQEHINKEKIKEERKEAAKLGSILEESEILYYGDFKDVLSFIPDGTVDAIITDPPYSIDDIERYAELGKFANDKLNLGGWLVTYSGQRNLPEVFKRLQDSGLKYYWTMALFHNGTKQDVWGVDLNVMWKPIIVYCKPYPKDKYPHQSVKIDNRGHDDYIVSEREEKIDHDWQQSESGVAKLIETFTKENDLIVDPFAGSGTILLVSRMMGRKCLGAEIEAETYNIAKMKLQGKMNGS
jgi:hypothetical protein